MKHILFSVSTFFILYSSFSIAFAAPAPLPQTGQTTCYDTTNTVIACTDTGQDGDTLMGIPWPSHRFTDNSIATPADQTLTDNLTGLIWTKNGNPANAVKNWQEALDYIKDLNNSYYLGHNDWRLPNLIELGSMINKGQANSSIWLSSQGFSDVQPSIYWSSSTYAGYPNFAWNVYMDGGNLYAPKSKYYNVWPVRAGQPASYASLNLSKTGQTTCYDENGNTVGCSGTGQDGEFQTGTAWPSPRFSDNGDQTVTDNLTGLIWTKNANPAAGTKTWQDALDYIKTLNNSIYLGHNDWRLPNRNELESMLNKGVDNPSTWLNSQGFPNIQDDYYWSSSSYFGSPNYAWEVNMYYGYVNADIKAHYGYVWPVHAGQAGPLVHLNISKDGSGSGTVAPDSGSIFWDGNSGIGEYLMNTKVTMTATPDIGSSFAGWSGACSGSAPCTVTMDAVKSVIATFVVPTENLSPASWNYGDPEIYTTPTVKSFTLSSSWLAPLEVSDITIIGTNTSPFSVTPGTCTSLTPTLPPATSCTVNVTFTPTVLGPKNATLRVTSKSVSNPTLDAQLTGIVIIPYYTLTTTSQGTGSGRVYYSSGGFCTGSCSQSFASGRPMQLTVVADSGSQFSGWSGCDSVTGDVCNVTMTEAKSVAAAFTLTPSMIEQWVTSGPVDGQILSLAINPSSPATIFAGRWDGSGVFRSNDGGSSWNPSNNGLTDTQISSLAINPLTPTTMYTDTANAGLFRSDDGGVSWSLVNSTLKGAQALSINPVNPTTIYANGCGGVCLSTDSGASWSPVNNGISVPHLTTLVSALAINPTTPDTLYAGAMGGFELNGGLFKSTNRGDSWIRLGGLTDNRIKSLAIDPVTPDTLYAGTDGAGVFKTTDGGTTWNPVNNGLTGTFVGTLAINPATPSSIYAGTAGGVFRSTDGGNHWNPVNNGLTNANVTVLAIDPTTASTVYAGTYGGGVFKLTLVTAAPMISVSPSSKDFGIVATYASSSTQPVTINNSGNADLLVTATTLTGANPGEFSLQPGSCPSLKPTLTPGASCTMEITFVPTTVGSKSATLQVASNDPGNPLKSAALTGIAYDPPPIGTITINNGASYTNSTNVTLELFAIDFNGTVAEMRFSNSNTSWSAWEQYATSKSWTLTTLGGDGSKTVFVQFKDGAGNASGSFVDNITLDTTPPVSTITSTPGPFYPSADGTFTFSATESANFQCQMDSGSWASCSSPFSFSGLSDGNHTFRVKATDIAGNPEATAKSYTFSIDTTPPDTTITGQPAALTNSASGTFTFLSSDPNAVFLCKLDSGAWNYCYSQFSFNGVANGIHTFSVKAIDRSGNVDLTPATYSWTVDTTPPDSTLQSSVNGSSATFTVGSPDSTATLQCKLDSGIWAICSGAINFTGLTNGRHTFSVRATDPAGNVDPTPATYNWTSPCNVQVVGGSCYASIGEALTAAPVNGTIQAKAISFPETINYTYSKALTISGGYGANFEPPTPGAMTRVNGFTMTSGTMTVENLVIQ